VPQFLRESVRQAQILPLNMRSRDAVGIGIARSHLKATAGIEQE